MVLCLPPQQGLREPVRPRVQALESQQARELVWQQERGRPLAREPEPQRLEPVRARHPEHGLRRG